MAKTLRKTAGSLWWLLGVIAAMVFGRVAQAIAQVQPLYGVPRPQPRPRPAPDPRDQTRQARQAADAIVNSYIEASDPVKATEAQRTEIARLIEQLGDDDHRKRDAASKQLVQIGRPALPQLGGAVRCDDKEIQQRAQVAIGQIEQAPLASAAGKLGCLPRTVTRAAVHSAWTQQQSTLTAARAEYSRAVRAGDVPASRRASGIIVLAEHRIRRLAPLHKGFVLTSDRPGRPQPKYGIQLRYGIRPRR